MKECFIIILIPVLLLANYAMKYKPKKYYSYQSLNQKEKFLMIIKAMVILGFLTFIIIALTIQLIKYQLISLVIVLLSIFLFLVINQVVNFIKERKAMKSLGITYDYIRNIPNDLSTCEISFLNNGKINLQKEFKTTLLKLEQKGAITIKKENGKISFHKTANKVLAKNSEKYVYDYIFSYEKQNFSFNGWLNEIKKEMILDGIIEDKKDSHITKTYFLSTSIIFLCFMIVFIIKMTNVNDAFFDNLQPIIIGFIFSFMILLPINLYEKKTGNLNVKLTNNGWFYKYNVAAFKRFITNFTRLKEVKLEQYPLWKDYLICAFILNVNVDYKKFPDTQMKLFNDLEIKENIENLIYNLTKEHQ